ncbi:CBS domain-containing protein [Actinomadura rifamycini]|uniref:CBS domain-containing protein n=1 Tax=Actinomadura rifamycini TaxID=31962 RepID=UPI0003FEDD0A|nr:CBS domain-containing protein [Actinomadura rifamycini]
METVNTDAPAESRTAGELMTRDLLVIAASESALMAWELMSKAGVHHLPVADDEGAFLGVLDAQTVAATWSASGPLHARRPVTGLLPDRPPRAVRPGTPVPEAARAMLDAGADYVAVTDEAGGLVGLLTARDLMAAIAGVHREAAPPSGGMPSLYRMEPVLPRQTPRHPDGGIPPD